MGAWKNKNPDKIVNKKNIEEVFMLRKKQEIKEKSEIESIIKSSIVCRLALSDDDQPYIVPLCFGYKDNNLYFHTGPKGMKLEILKKNPKVSFEFETDVGVLKGKAPCKWNMQYNSVIGYGKAFILDNNDGDMEKKTALNAIIRQYSDEDVLLPDVNIEKIVIIRVRIDHMTGKHSSIT